MFWHISGDKQLALSLNKSDITLYEKLGQEVTIAAETNGKIVIPVSNRRYIKANKLSKRQLSEALINAQIMP